MELIGLTAFCIAVLAFLGWYVWNSLGASVGDTAVLETLGSVGKWEVRIGASVGDTAVLETLGSVGKWEVRIAQAPGRRMVELVLSGQGEGEVEVHMFLTATEARLLAQWMRLGAARGRTLADARKQRGASPA
jgi:hypothetical protein